MTTMFDLFRREPLLDEASRRWLIEVYEWTLRHFGSELFYEKMLLVTPTDAHFPGRANSPHAMAQLVLDQVKQHAGLAHWPTRLVEPESFDPNRAPHGEAEHCWVLSYEPAMVGNPEALVATYAHTLSHMMAGSVGEEPPGGWELRPQVTEVLAVFLGFGLFMANTAYVSPKRGCGGCGASGVERTSYISQYDLTYALALFCALKGIPQGEALRYLKSPLRGFFKKALKEVGRSELELGRLQAITTLGQHRLSEDLPREVTDTLEP